MKQTFKKFYASMKKLSPEPRPYWYLDAKWICGIGAFKCILIALLLANFLSIIGDKNVLDTLSAKAETAVNQQLSVVTQIAQAVAGKTRVDLEKNILNQTKEELTTRSEAAKKDSDALPVKKLTKYTLLGESLIFDRVNSAIEDRLVLLNDPTTSEKILKNTTPLELHLPRVYNADTYAKYHLYYVLIVILAVIFLAASIYFSYGFGRLITPGVIMFFGSLPGLVLTLKINSHLENSFVKDLGVSGISLVQSLFGPVYEALHQQMAVLIGTNEWVFITGLILALLGIIGKIIYYYEVESK